MCAKLSLSRHRGYRGRRHESDGDLDDDARPAFSLRRRLSRLAAAASAQRQQQQRERRATTTRATARARGVVLADDERGVFPFAATPDEPGFRLFPDDSNDDGFGGSCAEPTGPLLTARDILPLVANVVGDARRERFAEVASRRCFEVVPVVEGLYDMGNLAAVLRSADALGYGRAHVIAPRGAGYKASGRKAESSGSDKWMHVGVGEDAMVEFAKLRRAGYRVAVTHVPDPGSQARDQPGSETASGARPAPDRPSVDIREIDWTVPTAFVLGNEKDGVSQAAIDAADLLIRVPMDGLVESLNVSVCASLILWHAREDRIRRRGHADDVSEDQAKVLTAAFCLRHRGNTVTAVRELLTRKPEWQKQKEEAAGRRARKRARREAEEKARQEAHGEGRPSH